MENHLHNQYSSNSLHLMWGVSILQDIQKNSQKTHNVLPISDLKQTLPKISVISQLPGSPSATQIYTRKKALTWSSSNQLGWWNPASSCKQFFWAKQYPCKRSAICNKKNIFSFGNPSLRFCSPNDIFIVSLENQAPLMSPPWQKSYSCAVVLE